MVGVVARDSLAQCTWVLESRRESKRQVFSCARIVERSTARDSRDCILRSRASCALRSASGGEVDWRARLAGQRTGTECVRAATLLKLNRAIAGENSPRCPRHHRSASDAIWPPTIRRSAVSALRSHHCGSHGLDGAQVASGPAMSGGNPSAMLVDCQGKAQVIFRDFTTRDHLVLNSAFGFTSGSDRRRPPESDR
jgi:hypothetical protein